MDRKIPRGNPYGLRGIVISPWLDILSQMYYGNVVIQ